MVRYLHTVRDKYGTCEEQTGGVGKAQGWGSRAHSVGKATKVQAICYSLDGDLSLKIHVLPTGIPHERWQDLKEVSQGPEVGPF